MKRILVSLCCFLIVCAMKDDSKKGFNLKSFEKSLSYIPMGNYMFEDSSLEYNEEIKANVRKNGHIASVGSFYMCNHVVSNSEYREYLNNLKATNLSLYTQMLPDTLVWRNKIAYNEPYVAYYFRHPAYGNYPVVGITHEQAEYYCKWLTDKYMKEPKRKYKKVEFKLPNVYQWEWAANGGLAMGEFPWAGSNVMGSDGKPLANFMYIPESSLKRQRVYMKDSTGAYHEVNALAEGYCTYTMPDFYTGDLTTPVMSYKPNGYGLYNMAGNVKEYVSEKGITKGGGWKDYGYYLQNWVEQPYDSTEKAADDRGFRFIMEVEN